MDKSLSEVEGLDVQAFANLVIDRKEELDVPSPMKETQKPYRPSIVWELKPCAESREILYKLRDAYMIQRYSISSAKMEFVFYKDLTTKNVAKADDELTEAYFNINK